MKTEKQILLNVMNRCDTELDALSVNDRVVSIGEALSAMTAYAEQFKPKWVSVDEPPQVGEDVIGTHSGHKWVTQVFWNGTNWYNEWDVNLECPCYPTHWQKLPKYP